MTSAFKIHDTVLRVSTEARVLVPGLPIVNSESKLLAELILCILSSQDKYEVALNAVKALRKAKVLQIPKNPKELKKIKTNIQSTLNKPISFNYKGKVYSRKIRFNSKKGQYIVNTLENIYLNNLTIKSILSQQVSSENKRKLIIDYSSGLGPKQASMFLRNIGYCSNFAILDKHVITYMRIMGLIDLPDNHFSSIKSYQKVEDKLKLYAETYNVSLLHLDMAIWVTMRTIDNNICA